MFRQGLLKIHLFLTCLLSDSSLTTASVIVIVSTCSVLVIFCIALLAFLLSRRLRRTREASVERRDENPVYQMYYFSDGQHVDYGNAEVEDDNPYYDN